MPDARWLFALVALGAIALPALASPPVETTIEPPPIQWPADPEGQTVQQKCLFCHGGELIVSQRLNEKQWQKELHKMAKWGSPITHEEQAAVARYLTRHFGPDAPAPAPVRVLPQSVTPSP